MCPKESSILDHVHKVDHYIILVLNTVVFNRNSHFRHLIVLSIWLIIVPLVIDPTKEAKGNVVNPLIFLKSGPSINRTYVILSIMNTQSINIGRIQVMVWSGLFTFEALQKYILAHLHGHCNILWGGALFFFPYLDCLFFVLFLKIIILDLLQIWWFCVLCIFHFQFIIYDDIRVVSIFINSIIVIIIIIIN